MEACPVPVSLLGRERDMDIAPTLKRDDTAWLEIGGNNTLKEFVADEFTTIVGRPRS